MRLTKAQRQMLEQYADAGVTTQAFGRLDTWLALVRKGLLRHSRYGGGVIESEITDAGRQALKESEHGHA